jgi:hypothetical protein
MEQAFVVEIMGSTVQEYPVTEGMTCRDVCSMSGLNFDNSVCTLKGKALDRRYQPKAGDHIVIDKRQISTKLTTAKIVKLEPGKSVTIKYDVMDAKTRKKIKTETQTFVPAK